MELQNWEYEHHLKWQTHIKAATADLWFNRIQDTFIPYSIENTIMNEK